MGVTPDGTEVILTGTLICSCADQAARVQAALAHHIALTRAEPGCLAFDVSPTDDPLVWQVKERFRDQAALAAHQDRVTASDWGRQTKGIARDYVITGLT